MRSLWAWHYCFSTTGSIKSHKKWKGGWGGTEGTVPIIHSSEQVSKWGATLYSHFAIFRKKVFVVPIIFLRANKR